MRFYLYLILFILGINAGFSAEKKAPLAKHEIAVLKVDSISAVDVRHFDKSALKTYRSKPEFNYKEAAADISWWERFWRWFWDWLGHLFEFGSGKGATTFWSIFFKVLQILLLALGVGALMFFIFKAQGINILG